MKVALLRTQREATEPLRSVWLSPRIVLLKDGKLGIYPLNPIPTGLELPVGFMNFPSPILEPCSVLGSQVYREIPEA